MQLFVSPCVRQEVQRSQTWSRSANAGIAAAVLALGGCGSESPPLTSSSSQTSLADNSRAPSTPRDQATDQQNAADPKAKVTAAEQIGRSTVQAIKTGNLDQLFTPLPGVNAEIVAEINETRALAERDFPELLEELDAKGLERSKVEFVKLANVDDEDWSPLGSANVFFRAGGPVYYVYVTWMKLPAGHVPLGMSTWFKKAE